MTPGKWIFLQCFLKKQHDLKMMKGQDMIKELARIAKDDVIEQKYERLLDALKETKQ